MFLNKIEWNPSSAAKNYIEPPSGITQYNIKTAGQNYALFLPSENFYKKVVYTKYCRCLHFINTRYGIYRVNDKIASALPEEEGLNKKDV